ncbi:hypothetical protein BDW62DRAFT_189911 [Aspergillus aurantiobrunneus]
MPQSAPAPSIQTKTTPGPAPDGLGRGLFASTDLRAGDDVLHIESPFVAVLDTERLEDTCSGCFGKRQLESDPEVKIVPKACTGCQVVKYCDKMCQAKDWRLGHGLECSIYKNLKPKILPINARAVLRMVLRAEAKKNAYTHEELDLFQTLETHIREICENNSAQFERITLSSKAVKEYSGTQMEEEVISAFGAKLDLNAFNLTNSVYDRIGLYLHPYAALINHKCGCNAVMGFDGPELYIKAIRPIAKDEQVFISYVDATYPPSMRRKQMRERYFFDCFCNKCRFDNENPDSSEEAAAWADAYALLESGAASTDKDQLTLVMQALISAFVTKTKQPFVSILDEVIASDISDGEYHHAFLNSYLRFSCIDPEVYHPAAHPLRAVHAWALAKLALHISQEMPDLTIPEFVKGGWQDFLGAGEISMDYSLIAWTVLAELVSKEAEYCTVPGFRAMVKKTFSEVHAEFMRHDMDPRNMREEIRREWIKLGKVVGGYYQCMSREDV